MSEKGSNAPFATAKRLRFVVVVLIIFAVSTLASFANPRVTTQWQHYPVSSLHPDALRAEMWDYSPRGTWGYTRWEVVWSTTCEVSLTITYTIPRHTRRDALPSHLQQRWDAMIAALIAHEQRHGAHAMNAAREMVQQRCLNAHAIVQKWEEQDRLYDHHTRHGRSEGVVFP